MQDINKLIKSGITFIIFLTLSSCKNTNSPKSDIDQLEITKTSDDIIEQSLLEEINKSKKIYQPLHETENNKNMIDKFLKNHKNIIGAVKLNKTNLLNIASCTPRQFPGNMLESDVDKIKPGSNQYICGMVSLIGLLGITRNKSTSQITAEKLIRKYSSENLNGKTKD